MSAEAVLLGLYPLSTGPKIDGKFALPQGYQPIPIHTLPTGLDTELVFDSKRTEMRKINAENFFVESNSDWIDQQKALAPLAKKWFQALGIHIGVQSAEELANLAKVADNLKVRKLHNIAMPAGISKQDAEAIIRWGDIILADRYKLRAVGAITGIEF